MKYLIWNSESDTLILPCFRVCENNCVDNNPLEESREVIYDKRVQVANIVPDKRVWNWIFLILIYEYNNNGLILCQDSMSNICVVRGIWNLCFEDTICDCSKTSIKSFIMRLSWFVCVYVWPSACLAPNCLWFLHIVCPYNCIWYFDRDTSYWSS